MDCLDDQFRGIERKGQNTSDKGELCEIFIKSLLYDVFNDQFKIFRGGKIVNIDNKESKQIDIVLSAKNTIRIFGDKGIYPIESVFGVFSITSTLDHPKLFGKNGIIEEFISIPKENPQIYYINPGLLKYSEDNIKEINENWFKLFPFKCAFGFTGDINIKWEEELNKMVAADSNLKNFLPDLIVVNKKGMIRKIHDKPIKTILGLIIDKDFLFTSFEQVDYGVALVTIINDLYNLSKWQYEIVPSYSAYFNKDYGPAKTA
jgi:hypothetical protein